MASRGGKRPGAGRKKGAQSEATKARKEYARKIVEEGDLTPLQVIIEAMREAYEKDGAAAAVAFAKEAAPYIHPKLASVDAKVEGMPTYEAALRELKALSASV